MRLRSSAQDEVEDYVTTIEDSLKIKIKVAIRKKEI